MMHKAWSSIEEVPYCFSRSYVKLLGHTAQKIIDFDPNWAFPDSNSSLNSPMAMKCCTMLETAKERCPCFPRSSIKFQGHTGQNITEFDPNWAFPDYRPVAAFKSLRFALLYLCNKVRGGGILDSPGLSVRLYVCPLTFCVRPVASIVHNGFFPYLVQMINSKRGCVACDDFWPWPISSRSFSLDFENRVRSVTFSISRSIISIFATNNHYH